VGAKRGHGRCWSEIAKSPEKNAVKDGPRESKKQRGKNSRKSLRGESPTAEPASSIENNGHSYRRKRIKKWKGSVSLKKARAA